MHSRFNSWSNIHLLSIIEAFLSGAVCMSLVWISKAVVSHIDEEAMSLSVLYKIVIVVLLVTVAVLTNLHVVCHHFTHWWIPEGPGPATHPTPLSQGLHDCPLPLSERMDRPLLSVLCCCFLAMSLVKILSVFFAHNIIIVMITIPTQQVYRVMRS